MKRWILLFSVMVSQMGFAATPQKLSQFPEADRMVYARLVEAYRRGNLLEVLRQKEMLLKYFKSSVFLDRAYYMSGLLQYQHNRLGEALKDFDTVTDKYVLSDKRPAAYFAMALTYKKLSLPKQAKTILRKVIKEYPASPEAHRAALQLRLEAKL